MESNVLFSSLCLFKKYITYNIVQIKIIWSNASGSCGREDIYHLILLSSATLKREVIYDQW